MALSDEAFAARARRLRLAMGVSAVLFVGPLAPEIVFGWIDSPVEAVAAGGCLVAGLLVMLVVIWRLGALLERV